MPPSFCSTQVFSHSLWLRLHARMSWSDDDALAGLAASSSSDGVEENSAWLDDEIFVNAGWANEDAGMDPAAAASPAAVTDPWCAPDVAEQGGAGEGPSASLDAVAPLPLEVAPARRRGRPLGSTKGLSAALRSASQAQHSGSAARSRSRGVGVGTGGHGSSPQVATGSSEVSCRPAQAASDILALQPSACWSPDIFSAAQKMRSAAAAAEDHGLGDLQQQFRLVLDSGKTVKSRLASSQVTGMSEHIL